VTKSSRAKRSKVRGRARAAPSEAASAAGARSEPQASEVNKINLAEKLAKFSEHWRPKLIGELNGQHVRLVKLQGEFVWHHHEREDELFLVLSGELVLHFRDRSVTLREGELCIVPRGVEHKPAAAVETCVLLLEPASTLNTGNVRGARTVEELERI
jgi:mannose-6-phosphate isomerase-like protein (cupin superfamily)